MIEKPKGTRLLEFLSRIVYQILKSTIPRIGLGIMGVGGALLTVRELLLIWLLNRFANGEKIPPSTNPGATYDTIILIIGAIILFIGLIVTLYGTRIVVQERRLEEAQRYAENELTSKHKIEFIMDEYWFFWSNKGDDGERLQFVVRFNFYITTGTIGLRLLSVSAQRMVRGCFCGETESFLFWIAPEDDFEKIPKNSHNAGYGLRAVPLRQRNDRLPSGHRIPPQTMHSFRYQVNLVAPNGDFYFGECDDGNEIKVTISYVRDQEGEEREETFYFKEKHGGVEPMDGLTQPPFMNNSQIMFAYERNILSTDEYSGLKRISPQDRYIHLKDHSGLRANRLNVTQEHKFVRECWQKMKENARIRDIKAPLYQDY